MRYLGPHLDYTASIPKFAKSYSCTDDNAATKNVRLESRFTKPQKWNAMLKTLSQEPFTP